MSVKPLKAFRASFKEAIYHLDFLHEKKCIHKKNVSTFSMDNLLPKDFYSVLSEQAARIMPIIYSCVLSCIIIHYYK